MNQARIPLFLFVLALVSPSIGEWDLCVTLKAGRTEGLQGVSIAKKYLYIIKDDDIYRMPSSIATLNPPYLMKMFTENLQKIEKIGEWSESFLVKDTLRLNSIELPTEALLYHLIFSKERSFNLTTQGMETKTFTIYDADEYRRAKEYTSTKEQVLVQSEQADHKLYFSYNGADNNRIVVINFWQDGPFTVHLPNATHLVFERIKKTTLNSPSFVAKLPIFGFIDYYQMVHIWDLEQRRVVIFKQPASFAESQKSFAIRMTLVPFENYFFCSRIELDEYLNSITIKPTVAPEPQNQPTQASINLGMIILATIVVFIIFAFVVAIVVSANLKNKWERQKKKAQKLRQKESLSDRYFRAKSASMSMSFQGSSSMSVSSNKVRATSKRHRRNRRR